MTSDLSARHDLHLHINTIVFTLVQLSDAHSVTASYYFSDRSSHIDSIRGCLFIFLFHWNVSRVCGVLPVQWRMTVLFLVDFNGYFSDNSPKHRQTCLDIVTGLGMPHCRRSAFTLTPPILHTQLLTSCAAHLNIKSLELMLLLVSQCVECTSWQVTFTPPPDTFILTRPFLLTPSLTHARSFLQYRAAWLN